jgi:hypothetical protein
MARSRDRARTTEIPTGSRSDGSGELDGAALDVATLHSRVVGIQISKRARKKPFFVLKPNSHGQPKLEGGGWPSDYSMRIDLPGTQGTSMRIRFRLNPAAYAGSQLYI